MRDAGLEEAAADCRKRSKEEDGKEKERERGRGFDAVRRNKRI